MKISFRTGDKVLAKETRVCFFTKEQRKKSFAAGISEGEFSGAANSLLYFHDENLLCIGLGPEEEVSSAVLRNAAGTAARYLKKTERLTAVFDLLPWSDFAGAMVEGVILGNYNFELFKTSKASVLKEITLAVSKDALADVKKAAARAEIIANATNYARHQGNHPGNLFNPQTLAAEALKLGREKKLKVTIFDEKALAKGKFGGLLAVGSGSINPPRLVVIEYNGAAKTKAPVAFVGKAITFDTGGISIKPSANMEDMVFDKCGGMAVLGAMAAIADLKPKQNVVGIIASAENMPGGNAYRPGDIVTAYDGKAIEILNTDAEGRVVLADAIGYARKTLKASAIVDLATLTGACGVALGDAAAGFWSTDSDLEMGLLVASDETGERLWPMPIFKEYEDQIKSDVGLIKNTGGRLGGACTAAAFLKTFAEKTPWAHLDIAYMANISKQKPYLAQGATGFGVRTLVEFISHWEG